MTIDAASERVSRASTEEARYIYETLLKCRETELNLHVGRSNLCLIIEAALFAFVGTLIASDAADADKWLLLLMTSVFGLVFSAVSISVVRGADFWIGYWEHRLAQIEPEAIRAVSIFGDHPSARNAKLLGRLPSHLKYVSSRSAIRRLFTFLLIVWGLILILSAWGVLK